MGCRNNGLSDKGLSEKRADPKNIAWIDIQQNRLSDNV